MKFIYDKIIVKDDTNAYVTYELIRTEENDKRLSKLIAAGYIRPVLYRYSIKYALVFPSIVIEDGYDYEEGLEVNFSEKENYLLIDTCPVGGSKIEIIVRDTIDKTKEYNNLLSEITLLKKKKGRKSKEDYKEIECLEGRKHQLLFSNLPNIEEDIIRLSK